jgi:hypothetical protein
MSATPIRSVDPLLKQVAYASAFREMARMADGRETPEAQLEWALAVKFIKPHPRNRGEFCVTHRGASFAYLWYRNIAEGQRRKLTEKIVLPGSSE